MPEPHAIARGGPSTVPFTHRHVNTLGVGSTLAPAADSAATGNSIARPQASTDLGRGR